MEAGFRKARSGSFRLAGPNPYINTMIKMNITINYIELL